jgi:hypothetical protein
MRAKASRSPAGMVAAVGAAVFLAAVVSSAAGTTGTGATDAGPPGPIPLIGSCPNPPSQACRLSNGCMGRQFCFQGVWGSCSCNGGGGTVNCSSCGHTASAVCSSTCTPGSCPVPPPQGCTGSAGCSGMQTCNPGATQWNACTNCSGNTSCSTTCGGNPGTGACSASTCAFGGGTCTPPAETCNGKDDDCNGLVDDGITCAACDAE